MIGSGEDREMETLRIQQSKSHKWDLAPFSTPGSSIEYLIYDKFMGVSYLDYESGRFKHLLMNQDLNMKIECFVDSKNERLVVKYPRRVQVCLKGRQSNRRSSQYEYRYYLLIFDLNSKKVISDQYCDLTKAPMLPANNPIM